MSEPVTAAQYREEQEREYGQFVAAQAIFIDGARAFNVGDPVPASHVERKVVHPDEVKKTSTKAGQAIVASAVVPTENPKG